MATTGQNFNATHGQSLRLTITVSGVNVMTAQGVVWVLTPHPEGVDPLIAKTLESGIEQTSETEITVLIDPEDWADVVAGQRYAHQCWVTDVNGDRAPVIEDSFIFVKKDYSTVSAG